VDHPTATHSAKYGWVSPRTSDAWRRCIGRVRDAGGHLFERAACVISVIEAVRCALGDFPISLRLSQWPDLHPDRGLAGWMRLSTDAVVIAVGSVGLDIDVMANVSGTRATSSDPSWVNTLRSGRMPDVPAFTQDDLLVDRELPALVQ
jgi:2,4-dienoyl-CoA reductase-like NADH-dependent reductase (Old Yellow Enzyme family)